MNVLVTDGNQRSALAATRALGKKGLSVAVAEGIAQSLSSKSKYCRRAIVYPPPAEERQAFQQAVLEEVDKRSYQVLFPMTDLVITSILEIREKLAQFVKVPLPDEVAYHTATDKSRLLKLAQKLNIPIPKTFFVNELSQLEEIAQKIPYPLVIKPSYSGMFCENEWKSLGVEYAFSPEELLEKYKIIHRKIPFPLIQEKIEGKGYGIFLLFHEKEVKATFAHRRIREKPPSGGVSVLRESVPSESPMYDYAVKLLRNLSWSGVAMVEFKIDAKDHIPKLMEINGRFWGSLQLAVDSGVNFPYLLYKAALGDEVSETLDYKVGVKTRWFLGDLDHLMAIWFKGPKKLSLPKNYPGRWRSLFSFLKLYEKNLKYEILSWDDPKPGLRELKVYVKNIFQKVLGRSEEKKKLKRKSLKGALHVHTTLSSDGAHSLDQVKDFLKRKEFDFVMITEHSKDVNRHTFSNLVSECKNKSNESFLFIPGVEFDCAGGLHILGIGIDEFFDEKDPTEIIREIHEKGGLAILAHPSEETRGGILRLKDKINTKAKNAYASPISSHASNPMKHSYECIRRGFHKFPSPLAGLAGSINSAQASSLKAGGDEEKVDYVNLFNSLAIDGTEIWNVGRDGKFLPSLGSIKLYEKLRSLNPRLKAYVGMDLHTEGGFYDVSLSVQDVALEKKSILNALAAGNFENRSRFFKVKAFPKIGILLHLYLLIFGNLLRLTKALRDLVKSE
jgi:predicted ATP-grasp superfamily ATP-dependent carboligase